MIYVHQIWNMLVKCKNLVKWNMLWRLGTCEVVYEYVVLIEYVVWSFYRICFLGIFKKAYSGKWDSGKWDSGKWDSGKWDSGKWDSGKRDVTISLRTFDIFRNSYFLA